jgi:hypothetical protein
MKKGNIRLIGLMVIFLSGAINAQVDTFSIQCNLNGDVITSGLFDLYGFNLTATPQGSSRGGGTLTASRGRVIFKNLSIFWTGKITIAPQEGFKFTPPDTFINGINNNIIVNFQVTDTGAPSLKFGSVSDSTPTVGQLVTITDSLKENTKRIKAIYYDYSLDSGKTWDSLGSEKWNGTLYLSVPPNIYLGHTFKFTPKVVGKYLIRTIAQDYFHALTDTQFTNIMVKPYVSVKPQQQKIISAIKNQKTQYFDLKGRASNKVLTSNCYILRSNKIITITQVSSRKK